MRFTLCTTIALMTLSLLVLSACGGGGGSDGPTPFPGLAATVVPAPPLDGSVDSYGTVSTTTGVIVGDTASATVGNGVVGLVAFDLSRVPANATITSAVLRIYQTEVRGNPYTDLGDVVIHGADIGPNIDSGDYGGGPGLTFSLGTISSNATIEWKTLDLTVWIAPAFQGGERRFDYQLLINGNAANLDNQIDAMVFEDADNSQGTGNRPQLVLTWTLP